MKDLTIIESNKISTPTYPEIDDNHMSGSSYSYNGHHKSTHTVKRRRKYNSSMAKILVGALAFGVVAGGTYAGIRLLGSQSSTSASGISASTASASVEANQTAVLSDSGAATVYDVSDLAAQCIPSIVAITCVSQEEYSNMFGQAQTAQSESAGSGIIIAEDDDYLYIATNNHVVSGVTSLTVTFSDDSTAAGTVKGTDSENDLAVVMVEKSQLSDSTKSAISVATLGDSDNLSVGSSVMAIGNALGYGQSVTTGVVSAVDREVTTSDSSTGATSTNTLIQTDAAINPGNSGGALFDMNGKVIGINSAKYSSTEVEGMGYAIPISTAAPILSSIIQSETSYTSESSSSGSDYSSDYNSGYGSEYGSDYSSGYGSEYGSDYSSGYGSGYTNPYSSYGSQSGSDFSDYFSQMY